MALGRDDLKLHENIFIETNLESSDYDGVILIIYPRELNVSLPRRIGGLIEGITMLFQIQNLPPVWDCDYVSGGKIIMSWTGNITAYHDAGVIYTAAKNGMQKASHFGVKKPLLVVQTPLEFPDGQLAAILGALKALYTPLQVEESDTEKKHKFMRLGLYAEQNQTEQFEKTVRNAIALEQSRIIARDIAGGDPERMSAENIFYYIKDILGTKPNIIIKVVEDELEVKERYPLLAAVGRAVNQEEKHKPRVVEIIYQPSDTARVTETLILVGKGVTYDACRSDDKNFSETDGISRDNKCGAAAVAGFLNACASLKPPHLKVIGVLCLCRTSIDIIDQDLVSRRGNIIRVVNTDAEGRLAMADALFDMSEKASLELNPHLYTIASLTGHARLSYGPYTAAMDNHSARAANHAHKLQCSGARIGEGIEVSVIRPEDLDPTLRTAEPAKEDIKKKHRYHQSAGGFLIKVAGLDLKNVKYTHLDIACSAGSLPVIPSGVPILSLCLAHKVLI